MRMSIGRWGAAMGLGLTLILGVAAPAAADPTNGRQAIVFEIACGGGTQTVVITGGVPAHVVGGAGNLLLRAISLTDLGTGETESYTIGKGKQTGLQGELETCTGTFVVPETGVEYAFTATLNRTPRGR
jgi:hypothetical protein